MSETDRFTPGIWWENITAGLEDLLGGDWRPGVAERDQYEAALRDDFREAFAGIPWEQRKAVAAGIVMTCGILGHSPVPVPVPGYTVRSLVVAFGILDGRL